MTREDVHLSLTSSTFAVADALLPVMQELSQDEAADLLIALRNSFDDFFTLLEGVLCDEAAS